MTKDQIIQYYIDLGLSPLAAAGMAGYIMEESSLKHNAVNKYSGAYGYGQWLGPRKSRLFALYGKNPTPQQQLAFTMDELRSTHKRAYKELMAATTPEQAADAVFGYYGFSAGKQGGLDAMRRSGQDGEAAWNKQLNYITQFYNELLPSTPEPEPVIIPLTLIVAPVDNTRVVNPATLNPYVRDIPQLNVPITTEKPKQKNYTSMLPPMINIMSAIANDTDPYLLLQSRMNFPIL